MATITLNFCYKQSPKNDRHWKAPPPPQHTHRTPHTLLFLEVVLVHLVADRRVTGDGDGLLLGGKLQVGVVTDLGGVYSQDIATGLGLV